MGFGQYCGDSVRWTLSEQRDRLRYSQPGYSDLKKVGHNRFTYTRADGSKAFRLHTTDIAVLSADGQTLTLDSGGYASMTTRNAMGEALAHFPLFAGLYDAKAWEVSPGKFRHYREPKPGVWTCNGASGGRSGSRGACDNVLSLYRSRKLPDGATVSERKAFFFDETVTLALGPDGADVVARDSDFPVQCTSDRWEA